MIEGHANKPLTEDCMREACGLTKKRSSHGGSGFRVPLGPSSHEQKDVLSAKLEVVADAIRDECLSKGRYMFTKRVFRYFK